MKQIKLEVGKTYFNGKGEEVKIVWRDNAGIYPFRGSDDEWYKENGSFLSRFGESSQGLIEEVPETRYAFITPEEAKKVTATRYTFDIPEGTKGINVSKEGNRIVVEMVPEKDPKPGDVLINDAGCVYIFKSSCDNIGCHNYFVSLGGNGCLFTDTSCYSGRPATPEEAQPLFDALKNAGKRWNPKTMQVEDVPEADRIREWVEMHLEDGHYNQEGIAEVIWHYLKHKEDEK